MPEEIEKKKNPTKSPLSHLYPSKFEYKDYTFVSNEQFLMFVKAKKFGDEEASKKIIEMNNQPLIRDFIEGNVSKEDIANNEKYYEKWKEIMKEIKKIGAEVKNVNTEEWEQKLPKFRFVGAKEKFKQNEDLKKFLMTVDKNHTFITENGIVTHNCDGVTKNAQSALRGVISDFTENKRKLKV